MLPYVRRLVLVNCLAIFALVTFFQCYQNSTAHKLRTGKDSVEQILHPGPFHAKFRWKDIPQRHPVDDFIPLPSSLPVDIPQIQHQFSRESAGDTPVRLARLEAVKQAFLHSWKGYKRAWLHDEVAPLSGEAKNPFGGRGATLVDSLDTLWIMGLKREFAVAVAELRKIDFATWETDTLNVFETTIRYLGGLLSAYDISGHEYGILLQKAVELGEMLYKAFDTPNRMPVNHWEWKQAVVGEEQEADMNTLAAEVGSLTLEFTRLSQLTKESKWYDAVARITNEFEKWQNQTKLPGLWPVFVDARTSDFSKDITFSLGAMADSLYEYFPKQYLLLGGCNDQLRHMYTTALQAAKKHIFFRPLNPENQQLLLSGIKKRYSAGRITHIPVGQHLACFSGGMVALAAKIFNQPQELETARQLVDGCLWAYDSMPSGIMPETFVAAPCPSTSAGEETCTWSTERWYDAINTHTNSEPPNQTIAIEQAQRTIRQQNLAPGFLEISDARYILRPEAIESVFILYRITGDPSLPDKAWKMFQAIHNVTKTSIAYAAIDDVTKTRPRWLDTMESFWTGETLKYFYLMFSEPDLVSLDDYVLNTEAHPLLRPKS